MKESIEVRNQDKLKKQAYRLAVEASAVYEYALDFVHGHELDKYTAAEMIPLTIRKVEYRLKKVKEIWKEC